MTEARELAQAVRKGINGKDSAVLVPFKDEILNCQPERLREIVEKMANYVRGGQTQMDLIRLQALLDFILRGRRSHKSVQGDVRSALARSV